MDFKVGVAGCGRMGLPMAQAMSNAGFDVRGFDVRPVSEFGGYVDNMQMDPDKFIEGRNVLFTIVRDIKQTEDVLFDDQAFLTRGIDLTHVIVCSTLSPRYLATVKQRTPAHIHLVDAPMSGAAISAEEKRLSFMQGGDEADIDTLQPLFDVMGNKFHRMGKFGTGMSSKVLNNLVAVGSVATTRLILDWAKEQDLDLHKLLALMHDSSGQNWFASNIADIEFSRDGYDIDNTIGILKKDVESALDAMPEGADDALPRAIIDAIGKMEPWDAKT